MMKTTLLRAENMPSADAFVSPPITASVTSMQVAINGESSNSGNKAGDMALASLWIRRLKPRKEPNSSKGEIFASGIETLHAGNSDPSSSTRPVGSCVLHEASSMKTWANKPLSKIRKLDEEKAVVKDALSEQLSLSGQQNRFKQGQGRIIPEATPYSSGFSQQINGRADTKSERKLPTKSMTVDKNMNSRCASEAAMISHTCSQAAESESQFVHAVKVQAAEGGILASSLGKPPLPPSHNKAGLPPKPAGHKFSGVLGRAAGKTSSLPTYNKLVTIPLQDNARHSSHIAVIKDTLLANKASTGPLSNEGRQANDDGTGCQDPLSKGNGLCIEGRRALPCTRVEKPISVAQKIDPSVEPGMQQLLVSHSEESLKIAYRLETGKQASSTLLKEPKTPSECSVVSSQADETMEAARGASTSASFPWEMFAGAAGPSRSAREEFVEVYNRARNELKNQKFSTSITKVLYKGLENLSGQARCCPDTLIVKREGQASDQQQQQSEIPEKLSKSDSVDDVFQQGGVGVTVPDDRFSKQELFSEKNNCASFLEGDFDINLGKKSQIFQSIHVTHGKESSSLMQGQCNGLLHGCVELPAVGQKDCSSTLEENSHCRRDFASGSIPEGAASTHRELFWPTRVDKTDALSHGSSKRQPGSSPSHKKTVMLLGKRQRGMFDRSPSVITGKESLQRMTLSRKSEVWLQRWYPPFMTRIKGSQEHKLPESNWLRQDLASGSAGNMLQANESDEHAARVRDRLIVKDVLYQRIMAGAEPEQLKVSSVPSAAAMAIVGTAAKHFYTLQGQPKRSFAFWSGLGMPAPQTPGHFTEKGQTPDDFREKAKRKLTFKADAAYP